MGSYSLLSFHISTTRCIAASDQPPFTPSWEVFWWLTREATPQAIFQQLAGTLGQPCQSQHIALLISVVPSDLLIPTSVVPSSLLLKPIYGLQVQYEESTLVPSLEVPLSRVVTIMLPLVVSVILLTSGCDKFLVDSKQVGIKEDRG